MSKKLVLCSTHGTGKSKVCERIIDTIYNGANEYGEYVFTEKFKDSLVYIPEQFREVVKDIPNFTKQTEEITLATYSKQLYLENLYVAQSKNILCDRSVLDTFIYYDYFARQIYYPYLTNTTFVDIKNSAITYTHYNYSKIYLIEPSDREIEDDGFRLTDKKQQQEIHQLFLEYFKDFNNVEIINQEEAHKEGFINKVVSEFSV